MKKTLLVMGGDRRMEYAAEALASVFDVYTYGFAASPPIWELKQTDILVLPYLSLSGEYLNTPLISQKIPAVASLDMLKFGGSVYGGGLSQSFATYCSERDARIHDFFLDEELTLKNADLTAEGAVEIILRETDSSIKNSEVMILGFGRVGKACAGLMAALGASVTVSARSLSAREDASRLGYNECDLCDPEALKHADTIINTVPRVILEKENLLCLKKDSFILDLASKPYGTDFEAAKELGIKALTAPGLPGKTAPKTAGYMIADMIIRTEKEGETGG